MEKKILEEPKRLRLWREHTENLTQLALANEVNRRLEVKYGSMEKVPKKLVIRQADVSRAENGNPYHFGMVTRSIEATYGLDRGFFGEMQKKRRRPQTSGAVAEHDFEYHATTGEVALKTQINVLQAQVIELREKLVQSEQRRIESENERISLIKKVWELEAAVNAKA